MEKIRMSSMGSTTSLFKCSKKMDSYVVGTRQKYWSDRREWCCTQVKTTSRNTIKIDLGTEFDLTIAQTQIKDWEDSISEKEILSCFNMNKTRYPFKKEQSRIELLPFNSPSCRLGSTNYSRVSSIDSYRKKRFREPAYSWTWQHGHVKTWQYFW
jgi:hypothetical protein